MKVLYLNSYFYPEDISSSFLGHQVREAIVNAGMDIVLYAPVPARNVNDKLRKEYSTAKKNELWYDGHMVIHRFPLMREGRNPLLRAIRYLLQEVKLFNRAVFAKDARECGIIKISSTPPIHGVTAALIKKCRHIPIVYDLQDVFPDSLVGTGMTHKGSLLWRIGRTLEDFTYRNADRIIVISQDFKRNIMAKGVPEEKIRVIYNWVDTDAIQPVVKDDNPLFEEFGLSRGRFTVVYAGNLGNAQNISIILAASNMLPEVQFALFGTGGQETEIRAKIEQEGLKNVYLNPLQPYERVSQVYSLGDVCVVSCKPGLGGSAMPSKTWTIMSCGRPVIASFDEGELKDILETNECGVFTHAGNLVELVESIKILAATPSRCEKMGKKARLFILDNLTKEVGTKKYVDVIKSFEK